MKRITLSAVIILSLLCGSVVFAAPPYNAEHTNAAIYVNGSRAWLEGYNIDDNNFFKIRDLANAFHGTSSQFNVEWNEAASRIEVYTQTPYSAYTPPEGSHSYYPQINAVPTSSALTVDGKQVEFAAYNIKDYNYFKLRDLAEVIPYYVDWSEAESAIYITTRVSDLAVRTERSGEKQKYNRMSFRQSVSNYGKNAQTFLYQTSNGFTAINAQDKIYADCYDTDFNLTKKQEIPFELDLFGCFYAGNLYNYIVFGSNNDEENDAKEVLRVVKYDKEFQRLAAVSVSGGECFTVHPFDAGASSMEEQDDVLIIHTSRERYTTEDGLNHQSQLTLIINTDKMEVTNDLGRYQANHVSHSFHQFARFDGGAHVLVDHGDAYPRSVVLQKSRKAAYHYKMNRDGTESEVWGLPDRYYDRDGKVSNDSVLSREVFVYDGIDLLAIPGPSGANYTGVSVGGLEVSDENYLVAMNTVDQSKLADWSAGSGSVSGARPANEAELNEREIIICAVPKTFDENTKAKQIRLTNYIGNDLLASTPYLVKLSDTEFVALWQVYAGEQDSSALRYVKINGNGEPIEETQTANAY
ncbi:MAG: copper amine oxidase N-terminal domain-containing protein, partial [Clostridiales bacterium]|nr:copper amine oxidase N-terminal domain-containing protein [Clostridiales bacterium]